MKNIYIHLLLFFLTIDLFYFLDSLATVNPSLKTCPVFCPIEIPIITELH